MKSSVSDKVLRKAAAPRDFSRAIAVIDRLQEQGRLNEIAIAGFAGNGKYEEMVVGLARWPTLNAIFNARFAPMKCRPTT